MIQQTVSRDVHITVSECQCNMAISCTENYVRLKIPAVRNLASRTIQVNIILVRLNYY